MAEGRVAEVVSQAGRGYDGLDVGLTLFQFGVFVRQFFHRSTGDGTTYAGHFQAVCQAVVDHLCARQRKDLRLVLQASEGAAEDNAIVIALEAAADVGAFMRLRVAFVGEEVGPVHGDDFVGAKIGKS